jgi:ATP-dependent DNA ligase
MKLKEAVAIMRFHDIKPPEYGTGVNGRIIIRDLENAIGDHFFYKQFEVPVPDGKDFYKSMEKLHMQDDAEKRAVHMYLRRYIRPMKAYRYTELPEQLQQEILENNNNWICEQKYNGWRMLITHVPGTPVRFYGGNLSTNTSLPVDYTEHLPKISTNSNKIFMIDAEAECMDTVIQQNGLPTTNTREAIAAILGSSPSVAMEAQIDAKVLFRAFDVVIPTKEHAPLLERKEHLKDVLSNFHPDTFHNTPYRYLWKKAFLYTLWKNGHEGMVVKNIYSGYISGGRDRNCAIKIKRTASGTIGDSIDAFVSGYILTPMYPTLVGGLKLSVYENDNIREIATITSIPDALREQFTEISDGLPVLHTKYYGKVLEIDGQELTSRNQLLLHAKVVSWQFREDKSYRDCTIEASSYEERF